MPEKEKEHPHAETLRKAIELLTADNQWLPGGHPHMAKTQDDETGELYEIEVEGCARLSEFRIVCIFWPQVPGDNNLVWEFLKRCNRVGPGSFRIIRPKIVEYSLNWELGEIETGTIIPEILRDYINTEVEKVLTRCQEWRVTWDAIAAGACTLENAMKLYKYQPERLT